MPKRKAPPDRRPWARLVNQQWQLTLVDGTVFTPTHGVTRAEASGLAHEFTTFLIGYLRPTEQLEAGSAELARELGRVVEPPVPLHRNSATIFESPAGARVLVLQRHH